MSLLLIDGDGRRQVAEVDFPLALGVARDGSFQVGSAAEAAPAAWLRFDHGRISIQPERSRVPVLYARTPVDNPTWLAPGETLQIGDHILAITEAGGGIVLTRQDEAPAPSSPGPAAPGDDGDALPNFGRKFDAPAGAAPGAARPLVTPMRALAAFFALLIIGSAFVLGASSVRLRIEPAGAEAGLSGFPPPIPVGDRYLALPGTYSVSAAAPGYGNLDGKITVRLHTDETFSFALKKLPGKVTVTTPPVEGATIRVDDKVRAQSPANGIDVEAGKHILRIEADRYLPEVREIEIEGMGKPQSFDIPLRPGWGKLSVQSTPPGADVVLDGKTVGVTPLTLEPMQGEHEIVFRRKGWKPVTRKFAIAANQNLALPPATMEKVDGTLSVKTMPPGATVLVGNRFRGRTPASFPLVSDQEYEVALTRPGFIRETRKVTIRGEETTELSLNLKPELGTVFITTTPPGATLSVNGAARGSATQRLRLQTIPQTITISRPGYLDYRRTLTPSAAIARKLSVRLKTIGQDLKEKDAKGIRSPGGQRMRLVLLERPLRFTVGAPRREAGRRSNETERPVEMTRSFLISEKEITNAEFRKFRSNHNSGTSRGDSLDGADQPVVNVGWEEAARYANWLSQKDKLKPAYRDVGGKLVAVTPAPNGYRLPTEAEWELVARLAGGKRKAPLRYPWGDAMPPPSNSGNYANDGARRLPFAIIGYRDGHAASAPVGSYPANRAGLFDLGGNVAEWCHDFYDASLGATARARDPMGPASGRFHVVKGSSWRSGTITELRLSYRDYSEKPRDDVGFRIARYVDVPKN